MYSRLSVEKLAERSAEYFGEQMFCNLFPALKEVADEYLDLQPEEVWSEAELVADELATMEHPAMQMKDYASMLVEHYRKFTLPDGQMKHRSEESACRSAFLVLLCAVYMLAPSDNADNNPHKETIAYALAYVRQHPLYESVRMTIRSTEEKEEADGRTVDMLQWQLKRASLPFSKALTLYQQSDEWKECLQSFKMWVKDLYDIHDPAALRECKKQLWSAYMQTDEGKFIQNAYGKNTQEITTKFYECVRKGIVEPKRIFELQLKFDALDIWAQNADEPSAQPAAKSTEALEFLKMTLTEEAFLAKLPSIAALIEHGKQYTAIDWTAVYKLLCYYKFIPAVGFQTFVKYLSEKLGHEVITPNNLRKMSSSSRNQVMKPGEYIWPSGIQQSKIQKLERLMYQVAEMLDLDINY